MNNIKVPRLFI